MPRPIPFQPEPYAWPGFEPGRYRRRVKRHVGAAGTSAGMALSPTPRSLGAALLTEREQLVLEALADGLSRKEIAERLNASVKTFSSVCEALRKKLGARSDVHAVSIGFRRGLLLADRRSRTTTSAETVS